MTEDKKMRELIVRTNNRDALDRTLQQIGGLVSETPESPIKYGKGAYAVRAISGDVGFLKFACENQGYAKVIGEREIQ